MLFYLVGLWIIGCSMGRGLLKIAAKLSSINVFFISVYFKGSDERKCSLLKAFVAFVKYILTPYAQIKYLVVEWMTGVGIVYIGLESNTHSLAERMDVAVLFLLGILVSIMDWQEKMVYPCVLWGSVLLHVGLVLETRFLSWDAMLESSIAGVCLYGGIYLVGRWVWGKDVLGIGDCYYIATIGLWFSMKETLLIGVLAFVLAGVGVCMLVVLRRQVPKEIPFIPSIFVAELCVYVLGSSWFGW